MMQKWEFLNVRAVQWKVVQVNGKQADHKHTLMGEVKGADVYEYLNQLGIDGWELVGLASDHLNGLNYALKRPLP